MALLAGPLQASELIYTPINPSFGGNPLNGTLLLNAAQAQNHYKEPTPAMSQQDALKQFNTSLQSAILSRVASALSSNVVSSTGQLIPGTVETTDFRISIVSQGNGVLQITTTDKATGQSTQFLVNQP
ncbi:curli assembly protein CsgF [Crenobacter cavernae]|uniref:Curli production assembly/transport component CsgF n=2 Tax=Crenobacter cavernae TaxID=2290923 RepID=A0A345YA36_9NEIS|nr:curli assembly protein CsgF [Crenobacter cavernae]